MSRSLSRRDLLTATAGIVGVVALAACGSTTAPASTAASPSTPPSSAPPTSAAPASTPAASPAAADPASTGKPGGKLVVATAAEALSLGGNEVSDTTSRRVVEQVIEALMREAPDGNGYVPWLAEKWDMSADGLTYTFQLKSGVKFHDGTPFDATAVKYSLDRQVKSDHPHYADAIWVVAKSFALEKVIKSTDVVDPLHVKVTLNAPHAPFLSYMASVPGFMPSPIAVDKLGKGFVSAPVGTGPFKFVRWDKGVQIVMANNTDYWGTKPLIDQLVFVPIGEDQARTTALVTGTAGLLADVPTALLTGHPEVNVLKGPNRSYLAFNMSEKLVPGFADKRVRQAVAYAINTDAIVNNILQGSATKAGGVFSGAWGDWAAPNLPTYSYSVDKAQALMKDAGKTGFSFDFTLASAFGGQVNSNDVAAQMQSDLNKIGIKMNIKQVDAAALRAANLAGTLAGMFVSGSSLVGDPSNFLGQFVTSRQPPNGFNTAYYSNPTYDKLFDQALMAGTHAQQRDLYNQMQQIVATDVPFFYMAWQLQTLALKPPIAGVPLRADAFLDFRQTSVS